MEAFMVNFRSDGEGVGGCIITENIKTLRTKHPNVLVLAAFACGGG